MTLSEFIATRRRVECVETALGFDAGGPNQPAYVYAGSLYIEIQPDDAYYLILDRAEYTDRGAEGLARLESKLYEYGLESADVDAPDAGSVLAALREAYPGADSLFTGTDRAAEYRADLGKLSTDSECGGACVEALQVLNAAANFEPENRAAIARAVLAQILVLYCG